MEKTFGLTDTFSKKDAFKLAERAVRVLEAVATPPKADNVTPKLTVESIDNHIYFYATVDSDRCLAMLRTIKDVDARLRNERITRNIPDEIGLTPIWLHIHSGGGDLFSGLATADQLKDLKTPIYSIVEGLCASAATLISMACHKRFIMPSGFMLIHQFRAGMWGTYEQFKDEMKLQDMLIELLIKFYSTRTNFNADEIKELLTHDSWFNAEQSVKVGLVDAVK